MTNILVKAGDWLQDCDPRYSGRKAHVHTVVNEPGRPHMATYFNGRHNFSISVARIHDADYKGRKGWKLTTPNAA